MQQQPRGRCNRGTIIVVGRVPSMIHFTPPICRGNTRKAEYSPLSAQDQLKALAAPQCERARLCKDLTRKKCEVREKLGLSWLRSACIAPAAAGSLSNGVDHPDEAGCRTLYVKSMDCSFTALPSSISRAYPLSNRTRSRWCSHADVMLSYE